MPETHSKYDETRAEWHDHCYKGCWLDSKEYNEFILELLGKRLDFGHWTYVGLYY